MTESKTWRPRLPAIAVALALFTAACGGGDGGDAGGAGGGDLSGEIAIDGSSTVAPLSEAIAEEFLAEAPDVDVSVATSGTGGGFTKFCAGETDISDASRAIKQEEIDACKAQGVEYLELRVGLDGLAIVTSAENEFVDCLSYPQMVDIFKEGGASTWDQIDPSFPNEEIAIFAPGTDSGTYDFFLEEVLAEQAKPRADYTASENDNTLVQGIAGEMNSWGFFGFAYLQENADSLKAIAVREEPAGQCTEPSVATIESGDYPLSRPLFIYVSTTSLERPEVTEFVRFYLETTPELIEEIGYIKAPAEDYENGLEQLDA